MQTTVITESQARKITGGRKPLVPVEYETACNALAQCVDLDEAKYWSDKSDALAAWAKIYHDDVVDRHASQLKLRARRRMGEIANEIRPKSKVIKDGSGRIVGRHGGPISLLVERGVKKRDAEVCRMLARMPSKEFASVVNSQRPPSPRGAVEPRVWGSETWAKLARGSAHSFRSFCRGNDPKELARSLSLGEVRKARSLARELAEWLDTFEQFLPKPD